MQKQSLQDVTPKLFPLLFDHPRLEQPISILDFGAASSDTVAFFGQFHCKLFFAEFVSESAVPVDDTGLSDAELVAAYSKKLTFLGEEKLDIFLFWDFFSLLDARGMKAFGAALLPYIATHAQAYGFGSIQRRNRPEYLDYKIVDFNHLKANVREEQPDKVFFHGQSAFDTLLEPFRVSKGVLLQNGRLEVLLNRPE